MIIKAKPFPTWVLVALGHIVSWILRRKLNRLEIFETAIKPGHSYVLMCNHFSFLDGFIAGHLLRKAVYEKNKEVKSLYIMVLEKQLRQNRWITRFGGFSIAPGTASAKESLAYAAEILNEPGNVLFLFPQGRIESNHAKKMELKPGIADIIPQVKGNCQLLWSSNLIDYYESINPSVYCHMLDCGTNHDFSFGELCTKVNAHHLNAIKKQ
ncbi:MAG: glycerol acyltransferase, partial [Sphingobacteriales bacterium]